MYVQRDYNMFQDVEKIKSQEMSNVTCMREKTLIKTVSRIDHQYNLQ